MGTLVSAEDAGKESPPLGGAGDRNAGEFLQVRDRFLRFAGGGEDGTFVVAENFEPVL